MKKKPNVVNNVIRESSNQSNDDLDYLEDIGKYWDTSNTSTLTKLDSFTKYVSRQSLTKFICRYELFLKQLEINGSVVEVGVHRGQSLMSWAHLSSILEPVNYLRKIIGFDTFEGFVELDKNDEKGISEHLYQGGFDAGEDAERDLEMAIGLFDQNRLMNHIQKVELIRGDVSTTLPQYLESNPHLIVSLLHLDADLYRPTKDTLKLLLPRIPKGGLIVFDELNMKLFPGETLAMLEEMSLRDCKLNRFPFATSMSYVIVGH